MDPQTAILFNSPALHALQRKQLISLCKRYRIKASGKNVDLIHKLQAFGEQLPDEAKDDPTFPLDDFVQDNCSLPATSSPVKPVAAPRPSEPWSVLEGVAPHDDEDVEMGDGEDAQTVKGKGSWKSAENGGSELEAGSSEFGMKRSISASSLSRSTSKTLKSLLSRSISRTALVPKATKSVLDPELFQEPASVPVSPEPGVARAMRPSINGQEPTIRLLPASPSASAALYPDLPTMESLPEPAKPQTRLPGGFPVAAFPRTSIARAPEISKSPAFVFGSSHPSRPTFDFGNQDGTPPAFTFASLAAPPVDSAAPARDMRAVMEEEMRALMAKKGVLDVQPKPLKELFSKETYEALGGKKEIKKRRFDDIHEKEFAKMPSILDHHSARRPASVKANASASTSRLSSTATPRRPRPSSAAIGTTARRQQSTAGSGQRRPSALPTSAARRIRPSATTVSLQSHMDSSQDGRATKKLRVGGTFSPIRPSAPDDKPTAPVLKPVASSVQPAPTGVTSASSQVAHKPKSSRFGFLAQGVESMKSFASHLSKPSTAGTSMARSTSAPALSKLVKARAPQPSATSVPAPIVKPSIESKPRQPPLSTISSSKSSLFAPTASSLAKQTTARPLASVAAPTASSLAKQTTARSSLYAPTASSLAKRGNAVAASIRPSGIPASRSSHSLARPVLLQASKSSASAQQSRPSNFKESIPTPAAAVVKSALMPSRPSILNAPATTKTPVKRGPQFKARVATKLQKTAATKPSIVAPTPGKRRSSVASSLVHKPLSVPSGLHGRAGVLAKNKKTRESLPATMSAMRRHSVGLSAIKARGRTSELVRKKPALIHTPKKIIPKAPTTPFFPAVPLHGISE